MTKIYVTKYALSNGIQEVDADIDDDKGMALYKAEETIYTQYVHLPFYHLSKESAIAHAEELRAKKLKSLEKSIKKIKSIKFD